jgi:hypothetical protein
MRTARRIAQTPQDVRPQLPGVAPVTQRQRLETAASAPLRGKDAPAPAGGLFDADARAHVDLVDWMAQQR